MIQRLTRRAVLAGAILVSCCLGMGAHAAQVRLAWDEPTHNEDGSPIEDLSGYKIYYGTASGQYDACVTVGTITEVTIEGLTAGQTYYFSGLALNACGNESALCAEAVFTLNDEVPPTFVVEPAAAQAYAGTDGTAAVPDFTAGVTVSDNATPEEQILLAQSPAADARVGKGATTVTVTATDGSGNTAQCSVLFEVGDDMPPVLDGPLTLYVPVGGSNTVVSMPDLAYAMTVRDNCSVPAHITLVQQPAPGQDVSIGTETVEFTATDEDGNRGYFSMTVVLTDAAISERRPTLAWEGVAGASWYYVWLSRNGQVFSRQWVSGVTYWTPEKDLPGGNYTWWVRAWGSEIGTMSWSAPNRFEVAVAVPGVTALHTPEGAIHTNELACSWEPTPNATWYQIWISRGGRKYTSQWIEGETSFSTGAGLPYGAYTGWVRAWGPDGYGPWSTPKSCSYGVSDPVAPAGPIDVRQPRFRWTSLAEAQGYELCVSHGGKNVVWTHVDEASWTSAEELGPGTYRWWVRIRGEQGYGPWSAAMTFSVERRVPEAVTLLGATAVGDGNVTYTWQADDLAEWYQIWITQNGRDWFSEWSEAPVAGDQVDLTISNHGNGKTYRWWVRAWGGDGMGEWAGPAEFEL